MDVPGSFSNRDWPHQRSSNEPTQSRQQPYAHQGGEINTSRLRIFVRRLPSTVTTLDIYENFKDHGEIVSIKILENRAGGSQSSAEIEYGPPSKESRWPRKLLFRSRGLTSTVQAMHSRLQPHSVMIESPVNKGVRYDAKTEIAIESIHFGVLLEPTRMMTFTSRGTNLDGSRMILDLNQKQIEIVFPSPMESENGEAIRSFRFQVPLDEDFDLWYLQGKSYVLHLDKPPWYSKQLKEAIAQTHVPGSKRWSIEDTWARQTDFIRHKNDIQYINDLPVSLQKVGSCVNISRWTTFKLDILQTQDNVRANQTIQNALRDFNVDLMSGSGFEVVAGNDEKDADAWSLLNQLSYATGTSFWEEQTGTFTLPFLVRYQLEVCLSHGWLSEYSLSKEFLQKLSEIGPDKAVQALLHLDSTRQREWDPMQLFQNLRYRQPVKFKELPEGCMEVRSAVVTATGIYFNSPTVEVTNRIIRKYKKYVDHFLRVRFEDDNWRGRTRLFAAPNNKMVQLFHRVRRVLRQGITLGDMRYDFLAWGNSQLREHGAYFFAKVDNVTAETIRADMGAFDKEKVVAKRAARMGQCFSTTRSVHLIVPTITEDSTIPDVQMGKYNFTDGVGKISTIAAQMIHLQLDIKGPVPSVFQFRLGGCKGVLVVWPGMIGIDLKVRASQFKFSSSSNELEVIRWSQYWQPFLNRQIIVCLSDLGVPDHVFLQMQDETMAVLRAAMNDDAAAIKALRDTVDPNSMTLSICELVDAGFRGSGEPFVLSLLQLWRAWMLKYLKEKAKIPVRKGAFVLGCADETGTLRGHFDRLCNDSKLKTVEATDLLPEIFLQINDPQTDEHKIIRGTCILARNPSLHRGDIRVVKAVDVPALRHLRDVVVMPITGDRDLPSMCSGGDLDGDDYIVIWDPDLIPEVWNAAPFHYDAPAPKIVTGEILTNDIIDFFYDYLQNDCLGRIAHAHLGAADDLDQGIQSSICKELVHLHSMAVDYPKTGVPAIMEARLDRIRWPHFMEKKASTYKSEKVLGKLYDAVQKIAFEPCYSAPFNEKILDAYETKDDLRLKIMALKRDYDSAMQRIMARHDIKTEFEVFSTFVLSHSKAYGDFKFHEEIGNLSRTLKEQYCHALVELAGGSTHEQLAPVAVAAYQYTNAQVQVGLREVEEDLRLEGPEGMPFISFPWLLQDTLCWLAIRLDKLSTDDLMKRPNNPSTSNDDKQEIHEWLANLDVCAKPRSTENVERDNSITLSTETVRNAQMTTAKPGHGPVLPAKEANKVNTVLAENTLCDPLNMSTEQMKAAGLNEDMELGDEL